MAERWWVLTDEQFRDALARVADGDSPGVVIAEIYANSDVEDVQ